MCTGISVGQAPKVELWGQRKYVHIWHFVTVTVPKKREGLFFWDGRTLSMKSVNEGQIKSRLKSQGKCSGYSIVRRLVGMETRVWEEAALSWGTWIGKGDRGLNHCLFPGCYPVLARGRLNEPPNVVWLIQQWNLMMFPSESIKCSLSAEYEVKIFWIWWRLEVWKALRA